MLVNIRVRLWGTTSWASCLDGSKDQTTTPATPATGPVGTGAQGVGVSNSALLGAQAGPVCTDDWGAGMVNTVDAQDKDEGPGPLAAMGSLFAKSQGVGSWVKGKALELGGDVVDGVADVVGGAHDLAGDAVSGLAQGMGTVVSGAGDLLGDGVEAVQSGWGKAVNGGLDLAGAVVDGGLDLVGDKVNQKASVVAGLAGVLGQDELAGTISGLGQSSDAWLDSKGDALGEAMDAHGDGLEAEIVASGAVLNDVITGGSAGIADGITSLGDKVDAVLDAVGEGFDLGGDKVEAAMDWLAEGHSTVAALWDKIDRTLLGELKDNPHADRLYGGVELHSAGGNALSEYGLPLTPEAWLVQDQIDGGKLRRVYERSVVTELMLSGVLGAETFGMTELPENLDGLSDEKLAEVFAAIGQNVGSGEALLDALPNELRHDLQEAVVKNYVALANTTEGATFVLELLPTDTAGLKDHAVQEAMDWVNKDTLPNGFVPSDDIMQARDTAQGIANIQGVDNTFSLPIPYANTVPNIVGRGLQPTDGAQNLHALLGMMDDHVTTVGTGYSQGGAALNEAVTMQGSDESLSQLDFAVGLASMGGGDMNGGTGHFGGEVNGTQFLSLVNEEDPAAAIHPNQDLIDQLKAMWNFTKDPEEQEGDGALHSSTCKDDVLATGCDIPTVEGQLEGEGTFGYPADVLQGQIEALLNGHYADSSYQQLDDFEWDLRDKNFSPLVDPPAVGPASWADE